MPTYTPLNTARREIRVLDLHPASDWDDEIRCTLHVVSLDDRPKFEALSYVWGDTLDRRHLVVDGDGFQATAVLESALRRLRHAKEPRQLWADAFCINQDDIKERNTQVPLMAEVYGQATRVLAWLGEDVSPSIAAAYRWANTHYGIWRLVREFQIHYLWKWTWGSGVIDAGLDAWAGVIKIFSHPYWTRMWTLQECMIPDGGPVLVCGPLEFPFQQLYHAVETTLHQHLDYRNYGNRKHSELDRDSLNWGEGNLLADMKNLVTMMNRPGSPGLLLSLFALTESCQCTVPHDHIYALYGLEPDIRTMYPPDYDKPLGQLAHETTIYLMRYGLSWFPSSRWCLQENPFKAGAPPSWVPDFTRVMRDVDSPHHYPGKSVYAHAIGDLFPCARHEKQDRSIQLSLDKTTVSASGLHLGRCDILLRFSNETMIVVRQLLDLFRMTTGNWESMDSPWREKVVPTKETMVDRVRRVVFAHAQRRTMYHQREWRDHLHDIMQPGIDGVPALVVAKKFKMNEKGVERLWADIRKLRGKTVFEVAGHIGISVTNVKAGDEVVIMAHNSCPAVLHSRGSAGGDEVQQETYVLVGFAYVEGLRDPHDRTKGENKWLDDDVFKRLQKQGTRLYAIS